MQIKPTELTQRPDIKANSDYYLEQFLTENPHIKDFDQMNKDEQSAWEKTVKDHYCAWLEITESSYARNREALLSKLKSWGNNEAFHGYISTVENAIVDSFRDPLDRTKVNLDPDIRKKIVLI